MDSPEARALAMALVNHHTRFVLEPESYDSHEAVADSLIEALSRLGFALAPAGPEERGEGLREALEQLGDEAAVARANPGLVEFALGIDRAINVISASATEVRAMPGGSMGCPMCGGEGRIYNITDAIRDAERAGTIAIVAPSNVEPD